jgi:hypothetical protein
MPHSCVPTGPKLIAMFQHFAGPGQNRTREEFSHAALGTETKVGKVAKGKPAKLTERTIAIRSAAWRSSSA